MPRTPLALVPLGEKDKEDVLLRYIHTCTLNINNVCDYSLVFILHEQVCHSINISKTTGACLICEGCGYLVMWGVVPKEVVD